MGDVAAESLAALRQANDKSAARDACEQRVRNVFKRGKR
jgi:hypothetical protein